MEQISQESTHDPLDPFLDPLAPLDPFLLPSAVALTLTAGERHDLIGFDALYTQAQQGGTLARLTSDRAYDASMCASDWPRTTSPA